MTDSAGMTRAALVAAALLALGLWAQACLVPRARASTPEPTVFYVYDLLAPAVEVPREFAEQASLVASCETGGSFDWQRIGALGERGSFQLHPIHAARARRLGLDYWGDTREAEHDRILLAVELWRDQGWGPWESSRQCWDRKKDADDAEPHEQSGDEPWRAGAKDRKA